MDLVRAASLSPEEFKSFIKDFDSLSESPVELYNVLMQSSDTQPGHIALLAEAAVAVYEGLDRTDEMLLFMELQARTLFTSADVDQGVTVLWKIVHLPNEQAENIALEVVEDIINSVDCLGVSLDQRPNIYSKLDPVLRHYGKLERVAELYIESAKIYSHHGASQAAYRCLADVEEILKTQDSLDLRLKCYCTGTITATEEGDYSYAMKAGKHAVALCQKMRREVPADLLSNMGVACLNLQDYPEATDYFESALRGADDMPAPLRMAIGVNLSTCYRRRDMLSQAQIALDDAQKYTSDDDSDESMLELAISAALLAAAVENIPELTSRLRSASDRLDTLLASVMRLHHRRELRERYIRRFELLLNRLPAAGDAQDVLTPLAACRANAMGDWLTVLEWAAKLRITPCVPPDSLVQVETILRKLRAGAPHLYGFHEKYDDPWSPLAFGSAWDELSGLVARIRTLGLDVDIPLKRASTGYQAQLCLSRLDEGHCVMAMTFEKEFAVLWCLIGTGYQKVELPISALLAWNVAQIQYGQGDIGRDPFVQALNDLVLAIAPMVDPIFENVSIAGCRSIRFVEDFFNVLPVMAFAIRNTNLQSRMALGEFEVRYVPALVASQETTEELSKAVAIMDDQDGLLLTPHESSAFTQAADMEPAVPVANATMDLGTLLDGYDVLIVSTHRQSLRRFTDAYFAGLGEDGRSTPLTVPALQQAAPGLEIRLAILNACFAGSRSIRNFQKQFRTSDSVSIPSLFLLNRRAVAFASAWKVSDTASFVTSHLIGEGLRSKLSPSAAIARAIGRLPGMTKYEVVEILQRHLPRSSQKQAIDRLSLAPEKGMFRHPYFYAGLAIYGLL